MWLRFGLRIFLLMVPFFVSSVALGEARARTASFNPYFGWTAFSNSFLNPLENRYTLGATLDFPLAFPVSLELEGFFAGNRIGNTFFFRTSTQYGGGLNLKYTFVAGPVEPFLGGELSFLTMRTFL